MKISIFTNYGFSKTILAPHCHMFKFEAMITLQISIWILTHLVSSGHVFKDFFKKKLFGGHKSCGTNDIPVFALRMTSPLGFKALFVLGGGVGDICSPRFTYSVTPLVVYIASIVAGRFPHMCVSAEVGC